MNFLLTVQRVHTNVDNERGNYSFSGHKTYARSLPVKVCSGINRPLFYSSMSRPKGSPQLLYRNRDCCKQAINSPAAIILDLAISVEELFHTYLLQG